MRDQTQEMGGRGILGEALPDRLEFLFRFIDLTGAKARHGAFEQLHERAVCFRRRSRWLWRRCLYFMRHGYCFSPMGVAALPARARLGPEGRHYADGPIARQ